MAVCPNGHDSASDDFCDTCGMRISGSPPPGGSLSGPASAAEPCPRCGTARSGQFCEACGYNFAGPRFTPSASPAPPAPSAPPPSAPPASAPGGYSQPTPGPGSDAYSAPPLQQHSSGAPATTIPPTSAASPVPSSLPPREAPPSASSFPYPQATWTAVVGADRTYYEQVQAVTGPEGAAVAFPSYCAERRFQLVGNQMRIGRRSVSRGLSPEIDLTGPPADPGISRLHAVLIAMPDGGWAVLDPGSANGTLVNGSEIGVGDQVALHDGDRINLGAWTSITVHCG
jgi:pSer/pThr/pTyr-binding forkhead associated (FHA) protein